MRLRRALSLFLVSVLAASPVTSLAADGKDNGAPPDLLYLKTGELTGTGGQGQPEKGALEIVSGASDSPEQTEKIFSFLKDDLRKAEAANPRLKARIIMADPEAGADESDLDAQSAIDYERTPFAVAYDHAGELTRRVSLPAGWTDLMNPIPSTASHQGVRKAKDFILKHYRITFTLARYSAAGAVTTWELVASRHLPLPVAAIVGLGVVGVISGTLQYNSEWFGRTIKNLIKTNPPWIGEHVTWGLTEYIFVAAAYASQALLGYPLDPNLAQTLRNILKTGTLSTLSQGVWDTSVINTAEDAQTNQSKSEGDIKLYRASNFLLGSAISVASAVAQLAHFNISYVGFLTLAVGGGIRYARLKGWDKKLIEAGQKLYKKVSCSVLGLI